MAESPNLVIPRRAAELLVKDGGSPQLLSHWRDVAAYVLLAEPGAGKTQAFLAEKRATGGSYVTASDFISLRSTTYPNTPIFIDGLDEIRAGSYSHRAPLDEIRTRLDELGRPSFRIACREADWRSAVDHTRLKAVSRTGELAELHLQELDDAEILAILRSLSVERPEEFVTRSEHHGVRELLANPLLLDLMVKAIGTQGDRWPESREAVYSMACARLAVEYNTAHRAERRWDQTSIDRLLKNAGLISSLCLLADIPGISDVTGLEAGAGLHVDAMPAELGIDDLDSALTSKLFVADADLRVPRHRTIAEFLAAGAIAKRIEDGLPVGRVLSLMSGSDGGIVDSMRGLHAWLATRCVSVRQLLIEGDVLGVVLYGDVTTFSTGEKRQVLNALNREAQRFPWFRKTDWQDHPFGALGTADMAGTFQDLLAAPDRSQAHQSLLGCVLDAIKHGDPMPQLSRELWKVAEDLGFRPDTRLDALDAALAQPGPDFSVARMMLDTIEAGVIADPNDELAGRLLSRLYPAIVTPKEIAQYFRVPKFEFHFGVYQGFWRRQFVPGTPDKDLGDVMDAWAEVIRNAEDDRYGLTRGHITGDLLKAALTASGDAVPIETLYRWLGVGFGKHGVSRLTGNDLKGAREWLGARASKLKALVAYGWGKVGAEGASGRRYFWESEEHILGATRPADWYLWLLEQAAATSDEELARYCFESAADIALDPRPEFALTMEEVEDWVQSHSGKWPQAAGWLVERWSVRLDHWQRKEKMRQAKHDAKGKTDQRERRRQIEPHLPSIFAGTAPPGLMNQIALAYDERFIDIQGETPVERVQDFIGGTTQEANAAITGVVATLALPDLPKVDEILRLNLAGRAHLIRPACLLGASLAFERDPESTRNWPDALAGKLAAFWLTEGVGDQPEWFSSLAALRPAVIAPVLIRYAAQTIRRRSVTSVAGLWMLAREDRLADLSRAVIPALLRAFPTRANERQLRILNGDLLPAASRWLPTNEFQALLAERSSIKSLDAAQRIAYLVAGLPIDAERCSMDLLRLVGSSESRAAHMGRALQWQEQRKKGADSLPERAAGRLIELIAPYASPERTLGSHWVGDADHRRDWVNHFLSHLTSSGSLEAAAELARLSGLRKLDRWKVAFDSAAFDQSRARRDASFRQASVDEVASVLANRAPANPQDLASLVLDHLRIIENQLRGDDTNGLKLFRRDDGKTPKSENDCRDALIQRLRGPLLPLGVHIEKEAQAAHDTRPDMRAQFMEPGHRLRVPIELKKEGHRELWSAWRTQLRPYTLDPECDGVGIYLVLWFGIEPRPSPEGIRPSTPQQLTDLLRAMIPEEDRRRIHVVVVDLSIPN